MIITVFARSINITRLKLAKQGRCVWGRELKAELYMSAVNVLGLSSSFTFYTCLCRFMSVFSHPCSFDDEDLGILFHFLLCEYRNFLEYPSSCVNIAETILILYATSSSSRLKSNVTTIVKSYSSGWFMIWAQYYLCKLYTLNFKTI